MGIRFSPGCECCGSNYIGYAKRISGNVSNFQINHSFYGPTVLPFAPLAVSMADDTALGVDYTNNVFNPVGLGLPLAIGSPVCFVVPDLIIPNVNIMAVEVPVSLTATVEFGIFQVKGASGNWEILSHKIQTVTGTFGTTFMNFNVASDGTIT